MHVLDRIQDAFGRQRDGIAETHGSIILPGTGLAP